MLNRSSRPRSLRTPGLAGVFVLALICGMSAGSSVPQAAAVTASCKPVPKPVISLNLTRFYADARGTKISAALKARHKRQVMPVVTFLRQVVKGADKYIGTLGKPSTGRKTRQGLAAGRCALRWMASWAAAGALLGEMRSKQAEYERKWTMTGLALAFLKLRPLGSDSERAAIEPWLRQLADRSLAFFDNPGRKRNNHWYWLGLGLGATGIATHSPRHWDRARSIMEDAGRDIGADGTLPMELARKSRALHYHAFAAMPLVALAELARAKGEDWYSLQSGALHRLVSVTAQGLLQPEAFQQRTGARQKQPVKAGAGWLPLYRQRFPGRLPEGLPAMKRGHRWLGGDIFKLSKALQK